jgi:hypothetical protein
VRRVELRVYRYVFVACERSMMVAFGVEASCYDEIIWVVYAWGKGPTQMVAVVVRRMCQASPTKLE